MTIFERDGFDGAKMADIAQEADVAKGTLYLYFETKIALLDGVVEAVVLPTLEVVGQAGQQQTETAQEILRNQIRITANRMASPGMKTLLRLMISVQARHPDASKFYYENVLQPGLKLFKQTMVLGVERGEFRPEVANMEPVTVLGSNIYLAVWKILFSDLSALDVDKLIEQQADIIIRGLVK